MSIQLQATDSIQGAILTFQATGLPPGISCSTTGLLTGTPTTAGSFTVTLVVSDNLNNTDTITFFWTINPNTPTTLESATLSSFSGTNDVVLAQATNSFSGGAPQWGAGWTQIGPALTNGTNAYSSVAYQVSSSPVTASAIVNGASINWSMIMAALKVSASSIPYVAGSNSVNGGTALVVPITTPTATNDVLSLFGAANSSDEIINVQDSQGNNYAPKDANFQTTFRSSVWVTQGATIPLGLTDQVTVMYSAAHSHNATLVGCAHVSKLDATIDNSSSGATVYTVTVTSPGSQSSPVNSAITTLNIAATDSGSVPLSYSASGLPPGLAISTSGAITGTPTLQGSYSVTVTAIDIAGFTGRTTFSWTITGSGAGAKAQVGATVNLAPGIYPSGSGNVDPATAASFNTFVSTGATLTRPATKLQKVYLPNNSLPATPASAWTAFVNAGGKLLVSMKPSFTFSGSTDTNFKNCLQGMINAFGVNNFKIILCQECNAKSGTGLGINTAADYLSYSNHYGPLVRQVSGSLKIVYDPAVTSSATPSWVNYYPGDQFVDEVMADYYGTAYNAGTRLAGLAALADGHTSGATVNVSGKNGNGSLTPIPIGIGELGTSAVTDYVFDLTSWVNYTNYVDTFFTNRLAAGLNNTWIITFASDGGQGLGQNGLQPNTTVAAGSNGANVQALTNLSVAATTSWLNQNGVAPNLITASKPGTLAILISGSPAYLNYTGVSGNTFTGCSYISGATGTISTGFIVFDPKAIQLYKLYTDLSS